MKNQVGRVLRRRVPRLGGSLLLAGTVAIAAGCSGENNPTSPSIGPGMSLSADSSASVADLSGGGSSSTLAVAKTMVCHRTQGTNEFVPTSVADSALQSHLDHGDLHYSPVSVDRATFSSSGNAAEARLAFDGILATWWSAMSHPFQWIEIDFGSPQAFWKISALVNQYPSGQTSHQVMLDGNPPAVSWTGVTSDGNLLTHKFDTVQTAQKVRISTTQSPSWVAWYEIQFPSCA